MHLFTIETSPFLTCKCTFLNIQMPPSQVSLTLNFTENLMMHYVYTLCNYLEYEISFVKETK